MEEKNKDEKENKDKLYSNAKKAIKIFGKEEEKKRIKELEDEER